VRIGVFSDVHGHADALQAVMQAAVDAGVEELWSLGDMVGGGPEPARVAALVRSYCALALAGNHDYAATGSVDPARFGGPESIGRRSLEEAAAALRASGDLDWLCRLRPAARRHGVQCWHGSPRNAVWEFVDAANAEACLHLQRGAIGLVGHTHVPAAWQALRGGGVRGVRIREGRPVDVSAAKWMLNPGVVGAVSSVSAARRHAGAWWLELDLEERLATWQRVRVPHAARPLLALPTRGGPGVVRREAATRR
jgi:predicted phosphodiesterase